MEYVSIFYYVMSHWTIDQSIVSTIDWQYPMAWFSASLLKHTDIYRHAQQRRVYGLLMRKETLGNNGENKAWFGNFKLQ